MSKGIRGFEGDANQGEGSLAQKAAIAWIKRWIRNKLERGAKMPNPFNLPDKPMAKSTTMLVVILYVVGNVALKVSEAVSSGDWSVLTRWAMSEEFWAMLAGAGAVFGLRKAVGKPPVIAGPPK